MSRKNIVILLGLLLALGITAIGLWRSDRGSRTDSSGAALIGGPFELVDHKGRRVTDKTYRGKFMLLYFGFTYCPDVCPTELQNIAVALDAIGKRRRKHLAPLFVTIDPERDRRELMATYVDNFHPDLIGLTGTPAQIKKIARVYRVYFKKVKEKDQPDGYTMDHSSIVYLMDDKGKYVRHFPYGTSGDKMAKELIKAIDRRFPDG